MKIKCPFCKAIYDPEVQDNTCPACNKRLLVTVFKKPVTKPGATPVAASAKSPPASTPTVLSTVPSAKPPAEPAKASVPPTSVMAPTNKPPAAEPKPIPLAPAPEKPAPVPVKTEAVAPPQPAVPAEPPAPVVVPPPPTVAPPAPVVAPVVPVAQAEKKHAPIASARPTHAPAKTGYDLVISIQKVQSTDWDVVIRVPVTVFKLANLVPARAREAIQSEGIDFDELRKAVEQAEHGGPLLDIQTPVERVHLAIEPHAVP